MKAQFLKFAGSGVRIAVWFRCSLSKQTENGNRARLILNRETTQNLGKKSDKVKVKVI